MADISRRNQILAALIVVQLVLSVIVFWPRRSVAGAEGEPLFPDLKAEAIISLTVRDNSNNVVQLTKNNGVWELAEADGYPAQATTVTSLLDKIVNLKTNRLISRTPSSQLSLKVADNQFERRIDFEAAGKSYTLFVGTSVGARSAHVRVGGQNEVYLVDDLTAWQVSTSVTGWIDTYYVRFTADDAVAMTLQNANGTFEFEKDGDGNWTMKGLAPGEEFNPNNLISLVQRLSSLSLARPIGKEEKAEYGLANPTAVITATVKVKEGDEEKGTKTVTLRIGAKKEDTNQYVARSSESDYYVYVSAYNVEDFVTRGRNEFLKQPTPAPTATASPAATVEPTAAQPTAAAEATPQPTATPTP